MALSEERSAAGETRKDGHVRDRLIEVAARHFAEHGIQGASQRAIQREVGVNNSTSNYYFGSKEALYQAVVDQALSRIQAERLQALESLPESLSPCDRLKCLLRAYLGAHLHEAATVQGYNYVRIVASLNLIVPDAAARIIDERIKPVRARYVDAFLEILPGATRDRLERVLRLMVGLMALAPLQSGLTVLGEDEIERITDEVVTIATISFEELCGPASSAA